MTLAVDNIGHSIGRPRTGDARISDLSLTGWSNALLASTQGGVVYWTLTAGDDLQFYRDSGRGASDLIASGTVSSGAATLTQDNTSGISGSCKVNYTSGTASSGRLIVSYADESDLQKVMHSFDGYSTANDWDGGGTRLESVLLEAKKEIDSWILERFHGELYRNNAQQCDLADIASPRVLSRVHACLTAAHIEERQASIDPEKMAIADMHRSNAEKAWKHTTIQFDYDDNNTVDNERGGGVVRLRRG